MATILWILGIICAAWVIIDVWSKPAAMQTEEKIIWTIAAILFSILTAIVYYFLRKR